jgi:hypothetical protein
MPQTIRDDLWRAFVARDPKDHEFDRVWMVVIGVRELEPHDWIEDGTLYENYDSSVPKEELRPKTITCEGLHPVEPVLMRCTKHLLLGDFRVTDKSGWPTAHYQMYHAILRKMKDESTNRGHTAYVLGAGSVRGPGPLDGTVDAEPKAAEELVTLKLADGRKEAEKIAALPPYERAVTSKLHFNSAFNNKVCARDLWDMRSNATNRWDERGNATNPGKELDERTRAAAIKAGDKACDQELADWVKTNWSKTRDWSTLTEKQLIKGMPKRSMFQAARAAVL